MYVNFRSIYCDLRTYLEIFNIIQDEILVKNAITITNIQKHFLYYPVIIVFSALATSDI